MKEQKSVSEENGFWAVVEVMGHKRYAGFVSEYELGGSSFVRVDVPARKDCEAFSKILGSSAIYCITPVSKEAAYIAASRLDEKPIEEWQLPEEWRQSISQGRLTFEQREAGDPWADDVDDECL